MRELLHEHTFTKDAPKRIRGAKLQFFDVLGTLDIKITTTFELSKKESRYVKHKAQEILTEHGHNLKLTVETKQIPGGEQN